MKALKKNGEYTANFKNFMLKKYNAYLIASYNPIPWYSKPSPTKAQIWQDVQHDESIYDPRLVGKNTSFFSYAYITVSGINSKFHVVTPENHYEIDFWVISEMWQNSHYCKI